MVCTLVTRLDMSTCDESCEQIEEPLDRLVVDVRHFGLMLCVDVVGVVAVVDDVLLSGCGCA